MKRYNLYRFYCRLRHPLLRDVLTIPTQLTDREKVTLYRIASQISKAQNSTARCVEVGSYVGASTSCIAAGLARYGGGSVYCIDTWNNDAMSEGHRDTLAEFLQNTHRFSRFIVPLRGASSDPLMVDRVRMETDRIDLLFIDGDHSFEGVLADWQAYSPLLPDRAVVAMHDIGWAEGVQRVVANEIRPRAVCEGRLPNLWWARVRR